YLPFQGTDGAPGLVVKEARRDQPDDASAGPQLATVRGQNVLDPVGVWTVGQGEDIAVFGGEHIDRCLVFAPGASATVDDDAEAGRPWGDVPGDAVQPGLVPLPHDPGNRHAASFIAAIAREQPAGMPGQLSAHEQSIPAATQAMARPAWRGFLGPQSRPSLR